MSAALAESVGRRFAPVPVRYTHESSILYALSLGCGSDPLDPTQLRHVYEKGLVTLPTQACVIGHRSIRDMDLGIDYTKVVHSGQQLRLYRPIPSEGELISEAMIEDVVDYGRERGAAICLLRTLSDADGRVAENRMEILCRGDGGFAANPSPRPAFPPMPETPPEAIFTLATSPQAALLYRLNGDANPLHADPDVARKAGFDRPILHGLATFGMAARAVLACIGEKSTLGSIGGRFSAPVYPGETLVTEIWRNGADIRFRTLVAERAVVVLNHGTARVIG